MYRDDDTVSFIVGKHLSFDVMYAINGSLHVTIQARGCTPKTVCRNFDQPWKNSSMSTWDVYISCCFCLTPV
jgi:hypothetical protein